jgi:tripartite-type tricarboxylate transporter receptor subunit TctC
MTPRLSPLYRLAAAAAVLMASAAGTLAQGAWPQSTVKIIVPYPPGGGADSSPRILIDSLAKNWGQAVVIENRSGAGGNVGAEVASRAAGDGYTFFATPSPVLAVNQLIYKKLNFDPASFKPVVMMSEIPTVISTHPSLGVSNVRELIAKAKAETIAYGSQGNGSTSHLSAAMFEAAAGVKLNHVPYRGSGPLVNDHVGGHIKLTFDNLASGIAQHQAGNLKFIAIGSEKRSVFLPQIPTVIEAGLPGFVSVARFVIAAPAGTPDDIIAKVNKDVNELLASADVKSKYASLGASPVGDTPQAMGAFIDSERKRWAEVIKSANIPQVE